MKKLLSLLVAAVFAVSSGFAVAASHAGAPMKKDEMKKGDGKDGKKAAKAAKAAKKGDKKGAKKDDKK
jgi:Ni/Co efflux regulator RcnB